MFVPCFIVVLRASEYFWKDRSLLANEGQRLNAAAKRLDVRHRKLYPWAPAFAIDCLILLWMNGPYDAC